VFSREGTKHPFLMQYSQALEKLKFNPFKGFIKGFVDMIFIHEGRYYLVDWKSNYLGHRPRHYDKEALNAAMVEHHYVLQYHLYVMALRKYLRLTGMDFRYGDHFGGVLYLFIRGMDPEEEYGIFFDRPSEEILSSLESVLTTDGIS
jgi:exodeoxyribonuclease V beta subunit